MNSTAGYAPVNSTASDVILLQPPGCGRRRADVFAKIATALTVGDYLKIHTRWREHDRGVDEEFKSDQQRP